MSIKKNFSSDIPEDQYNAQMNRNFQEVNNRFKTNIVKDLSGTPRVLIGEQEDGFGTGNNYGIKVSQSGSDVLTASDDNLVMSSAFNMLKIVESGTATFDAWDIPANSSLSFLNTVANNNAVIINHDYTGEKLAFMAFAYFSGGDTHSFPGTYPASTNLSGDILAWSRLGVDIDAGSINLYRIGYNSHTSAVTMPSAEVTYYVYRETAN